MLPVPFDLLCSVINALAWAFPTSALRKEREERAPTVLLMPARSKVWATRRQLEILTFLHTQEGPDNVAAASAFRSTESHPFAKKPPRPTARSGAGFRAGSQLYTPGKFRHCRRVRFLA